MQMHCTWCYERNALKFMNKSNYQELIQTLLAEQKYKHASLILNNCQNGFKEWMVRREKLLLKII